MQLSRPVVFAGSGKFLGEAKPIIAIEGRGRS